MCIVSFNINIRFGASFFFFLIVTHEMEFTLLYKYYKEPPYGRRTVHNKNDCILKTSKIIVISIGFNFPLSHFFVKRQ